MTLVWGCVTLATKSPQPGGTPGPDAHHENTGGVGSPHRLFPPLADCPAATLSRHGGTHYLSVTYSTDVTCLSWVWRESSILWGVEGGTSGGRSCTVYIFGADVKSKEWESVCQTEYNCVSVSTYLIGSGFFIGSQN